MRRAEHIVHMEHLKGKDHSEDLSVNGWKILK
jgi:hypothetical protein